MADPITELIQQARANAAIPFEDKKEAGHAYYVPSDEPLEWPRNGVVRLDVAIYAMHMTTARIAVRSLPEIIRKRAEQMRHRLADQLAKREAMTLAALGRAIVIVIGLVELWERVQLEKEIERAIRAGSLNTMRELHQSRLSQEKHSGRKVKRVSTRNPNGRRKG